MKWRGPHSLRARLLWLLFAAVSVTVVAQAWVAYRAATTEADEIFDYHMQQAALSLRSGLPLDEWTRRSHLPSIDQGDAFIVRVWSMDGLLVFRSIELPVLPPRLVLGFSVVDVQGVRYRVYAVASPTHVIEIAQNMDVRSAMARTLALRTIAPLALMAPLLLLVVWWVVSSSLAPVSRVRRQVAARQAEDLSEVGEAGLPDEVRPLIHEMNLLFQRVRRAFEAQKTFVADAAHELRSPLAALKLQVQGLRRAADDASRTLMANRLDQGIDRAARLVEQLLVLARQQAGAADMTPEPLVLADVARIEIGDATAQAAARKIDLGLAHADDSTVSGHREALRILIRNLLDNAIKYAPEGGTVDLEIRRSPVGVTLSVDDNGPGVAETDRERVLDRFYRAAGTEKTGSGLGLAIVKSIADWHGATLRLDRSARLGGLRVEVGFPALA
jgi:two-component system, OmpR family, sensor kinase